MDTERNCKCGCIVTELWRSGGNVGANFTRDGNVVLWEQMTDAEKVEVVTNLGAMASLFLQHLPENVKNRTQEGIVSFGDNASVSNEGNLLDKFYELVSSIRGTLYDHDMHDLESKCDKLVELYNTWKGRAK